MSEYIQLLNNHTFFIVSLGSALLGMISGILGCFSVLQKKSLLGDGISHAALPGVVCIFMLTSIKRTEVLLLGALLSGILATLIISAIVRYTRIKFDGALALIMSVFFGAGIMLLTLIQNSEQAGQAGLDRFIFGQASALLTSDIWFIAACSILIFVIILLFWKEFKLLTFDTQFAEILGFKPRRLNLLLSFLIVIGIIIGLQTVGVVLMSAMLIAPAVAARQWSNSLVKMVVISAIFGATSGIAGTVSATLVPKLPTGPAIVVCISVITAFSLLFAPGRGIIHRLHQRHLSKLYHKSKEVTF